MTAWQPEPGLDSDLREFSCNACWHRWYQLIPLEEQGDYMA
ncbi:unnamed protein product [marine sediment metagenome]|uniref:Uncharacterized protein n=1 Tax=marine sediment metagenome TaxID=412755 RepID=X1KA25_9ZZZZ